MDTGALVEALRDGGSGPPSTSPTPNPSPADHPLWSLPGVVVTPHVGGNSTAFRPRMVALLRAQVARLVAGEDLANVVSRTVAS